MAITFNLSGCSIPATDQGFDILDDLF